MRRVFSASPVSTPAPFLGPENDFDGLVIAPDGQNRLLLCRPLPLAQSLAYSKISALAHRACYDKRQPGASPGQGSSGKFFGHDREIVFSWRFERLLPYAVYARASYFTVRMDRMTLSSLGGGGEGVDRSRDFC